MLNPLQTNAQGSQKNNTLVNPISIFIFSHRFFTNNQVRKINYDEMNVNVREVKRNFLTEKSNLFKYRF